VIVVGSSEFEDIDAYFVMVPKGAKAPKVKGLVAMIDTVNFHDITFSSMHVSEGVSWPDEDEFEEVMSDMVVTDEGEITGLAKLSFPKGKDCVRTSVDALDVVKENFEHVEVVGKHVYAYGATSNDAFKNLSAAASYSWGHVSGNGWVKD